MEESQIKGQLNRQISRLKLVLTSPLVQNYEYLFPNAETVTLKIACIQNVELMIMEGLFHGSLLVVQKIEDYPSWLQFLSIRKRLSQIEVAQGIDDTLFHGFDAIKCKSSSIIYGISSRATTIAFSNYVHETNLTYHLKQRIVHEYKHIMNDLQEHQIIIGENFSIKSLRINKKHKPVIRIDPIFYIQNYPPHQYIFYPQKANSYEQDVKLIQKLISQAFECLPVKEIILDLPTIQLDKINQIVDFTFLLSELKVKNFSQVHIQNKSSKILNSIVFLEDLFTHFCVDGKLSDAIRVIEFKKSKLANSQYIYENQRNICKLEKCIKIESLMKIQERKNQNISKTYIQSLKKLYYNPLQISQSQKKSNSFVTVAEIKRFINTIKPFNRANKCLYHFMKAKQAWLNLNFTKSLAHLQKSMQNTSSAKLLSKIHLQMGRMWSHLCDFTKAERQYQISLKLTEKLQGSESLSLLNVLQNLLILYSKMEDIKRSAEIHFRCERIKKRFSNMHFRLMPSLVHSVSTPILFKVSSELAGSYSGKFLSKEDILKMQIERIPCLEKIWQTIRPYFEKGDKDFDKNLEKNQHLFELGQLNMLYFVMKIIHNVQNELSFNPIQQISLMETMQKAKKNNIRIFYRLTFLLSSYYQRHNQFIKAIELLKNLMKYSSFSLAINNSFRKRVLELAKKGKITAQLNQIYSDFEWLGNQGMMEQLYNSALFFQNSQNHLYCMKSCKKYLQSITDYIDPQEGFSKNNKIINRQNRIQIILGKSLIELMLFTEAWSLLKSINEEKIDKQEICRLVVLFIKKTYIQKEYLFCIQAYADMIEVGALLKLEPEEGKNIWLSTVSSLLNASFSLETIQQSLVKLYNELPQFHIQIAATSLPSKILLLASRNSQWAKFNHMINLSKSSLILTDQLEQPKTFENKIDKFCKDYSVQEGKKLFQQLGDKLQQINMVQIITLIDYLKNEIIKSSVLKGKTSDITVCLHFFLFKAISCIDWQHEQVLLILWFSSLSRKLTELWETEVGGKPQSRELLLDKLLFLLFKNEPRPIELKISQLWWVDSKIRDLLKLWVSFRRIVSADDPSEQQTMTFRILYGIYFSKDEAQSFLLKEVKDKVGNFIEQ